MLRTLREFIAGPVGAVVGLVSGVLVVVALVRLFGHHARAAWMYLFFASVAVGLLTFWRFHQMRVERDMQQTESAFEVWLRERIAAAEAIKGQRGVQGDQWYFEQTGVWGVENVNGMAGYDSAGHRTGNGLAPSLVDSYRRNPATGQIGIPPPHGVAEYEHEFDRQLAWLRQKLDELHGKGRFRRLFAACFDRWRAGSPVSSGSSDRREDEPDQPPEPGAGEGPTHA